MASQQLEHEAKDSARRYHRAVDTLAIDPHDPDPRLVAEVAVRLCAGAVVAIPTETFYGLAADVRRPEAVARLNRIKGKRDTSPALLLAADLGQAEGLGVALPAAFARYAARFWPGALTLLIAARQGLPAGVVAEGKVAVRVPALRLARELAAGCGAAITAPSANRSGARPATRPEEVARALGSSVDLLVDGGETPGGAPSTLLDLTTTPPRVVREGAVPAARLL